MIRDDTHPALKICPLHGIRDQHGIYCNHPMGTRLQCGKRIWAINKAEGLLWEIFTGNHSLPGAMIQIERYFDALRQEHKEFEQIKETR